MKKGETSFQWKKEKLSKSHLQTHPGVAALSAAESQATCLHAYQ